jgi:uncharacterized membrane protein HdeD (DUF308 family)
MHTLADNWWVLPIRGLLAILFAVFTFANPGITLASLILLFGAYAFFDGVMHLIAAVRSGGGEWWALLLAGILSIGTGLVAIFYPGLTAVTLVYFIAFWSITSGASEIIAAIRLRKEIEGEWLLALAGLLSLIFGIFVAMAPGAGALGLVMVIAGYAFVAGLVLIGLGFKLRAFGNNLRNMSRAAGGVS